MKIDIKKDWKDDKNLIVVDVSAVMRTKYLPLFSERDRAFNPRLKFARKMSYMVDGEETNTSAMYGLLYLFKMYGTDSDYVFCFDSPHNLLKNINKNYKNNRVKMGDEYFDQVNTMYKVLTASGFRTAILDGYEADHLIHKVVKDNYNTYDNIAVVTNDKDLASLVDKKVVWIDTLKKRSDITLENYSEVVGCPYNMVNLMKATVGDTSDNIKGIHRFGIKRFEKMIEEDDLLNKQVHGNEIDIIYNSSYLNDEQRGQALQMLSLVLPLEIPDDVITTPSSIEDVNISYLRTFLNKYGMNSFKEVFPLVAFSSY